MESRRSDGKMWSVILTLYFFMLLGALWLAVYSHLFPGIFVFIGLILRNRIRKYMTEHGFIGLRGYLGLLILFEICVESLFWIGGWRQLPGISLPGVLLLNLPFWVLEGILFYSLALWLDYGTTGMLLLSAVLGILIENLLRFGIFGWLSIPLMLINGVNYSFVLGFPFWMTTNPEVGTKRKGWVRYIPGLILPDLLFWVYAYIALNVLHVAG